ncbi:hypothetical protein [Streptomyces tateyamensis]|uniref:hypothetical protein n=1 Tax=Streptomyces tateyamensis TaxID=565073 RepID=UPI0011B802E3|nr:hypothetical protein [Streptomyces tateyamensis]
MNSPATGAGVVLGSALAEGASASWTAGSVGAAPGSAWCGRLPARTAPASATVRLPVGDGEGPVLGQAARPAVAEALGVGVGEVLGVALPPTAGRQLDGAEGLGDALGFVEAGALGPPVEGCGPVPGAVAGPLACAAGEAPTGSPQATAAPPSTTALASTHAPAVCAVPNPAPTSAPTFPSPA